MEIYFTQSQDIKEYRPLISSLIPDFDYVFLHTILQWCDLADDPYKDKQFWQMYLVKEKNDREALIETLKIVGKNFKPKHSTIGMCGLYSLVAGSTEQLWLGWLGIIPKLRNKGLGKDVMQFLYTEANKVGCKELMSYVDKDGAPLNFYKREGFEVLGTVKEYLKKYNKSKIDGSDFESQDDIVIRKFL